MTVASSSTLFVLPDGQHAKLCKADAGEIVEIAPLSLPGMNRFTIAENGWIACVTRKGRKISVAKLASDQELTIFPGLTLPVRYSAYATAIAGDIIYVGGKCGQEVLGFYDLSSEKPTWTPMDVPQSLKREGKAIDDLLLDGQRLIAVDNIVYPKSMLVYDVTAPGHPKLQSEHNIPHHGTYEHIIMGAIGASWLALLSSSVGRAGCWRYVGIFDKHSLHEYGNISLYVEDEWGGTQEWQQITFLGNLLLIAAGMSGIGIVDLSDIKQDYEPPEPTENPRNIPEHVWDALCSQYGGSSAPGFEEKCADRLRYIFPPKLADGEVVKIIPNQLTKEVVVILRVETKYKAEVVTEDDLLISLKYSNKDISEIGGTRQVSEEERQVVEEEMDFLSNIVTTLKDTYALELNEDDKIALRRLQEKLNDNPKLLAVLNSNNTLEDIRRKFNGVVEDLLLDFVDTELDLYKKLTDRKVKSMFKQKLFEGFRKQFMPG